MDAAARKKILNVLDSHRIMTVATNRKDGWPQATTVGYANDGLTLYFLCSAESQKAKNITRDDRISVTVDSDTTDPMAIRGVSMAARAAHIKDRLEVARIIELLAKKYPEYRHLAPDLSMMLAIRVTPEVVSLLDYSRGFGHTELITVDPGDLAAAA